MKNSLPLEELLNKFNITLFENQDIFDFFDLPDNSSVIDIFPERIHSNEKYSFVEMFYQKVLDKEVELSKFECVENKFVELIKTLWLYNDVYVSIFSNDDTIIKNYYYKRNKTIFEKYSKFIAEMTESIDRAFLIDDGNLLETLCKIATRDIATVMFCFNNSKTIFLLNDCAARVHFAENADVDLVNKVVDNNSLYMHSL